MAEPTFVGGLEKFATRFVILAAGLYHSAALAEDGAVWTWGKELEMLAYILLPGKIAIPTIFITSIRLVSMLIPYMNCLC